MLRPDAKTGIRPDRGTVRLWTLLLVPPLMWGLHLQVSYSIHTSACDAQNKLMLFLVSFIAFVVLVINGWIAWSSLVLAPPEASDHGAGGPEESEPRWQGRTRFMLLVALINSIFFAVVVIGQTIPMIVLRACD